ncbi:type 1 periplasmic-binding domain-containing protein [Niabella drilacis]|uniref:ABC-type branched-chain amino acid transport system, substrate-binding protein n=1 Tax=Niabella drilacis (strain DSM 25811 / CCM 8410 / CCUG 62505 / LMG 26954 / E90) TaxID=1285928 RepID=A0A1G6VP73_NIADE|nr:ABC transporter substrate-binding protein [Niabella drilacis]SDD55359.1 ABC-type branched-chain amino acid transport system, substrate-binding protein [Niabella drilacis]
MKKLSLFVFLAICSTAAAQVTTGQRHKMAIFTPLYLDNAFGADGSYTYSGKSFPKASIPGLEFYHGASMAIDSLVKLNIPLDVYIYDSKSAKQSLESQVNKAAADGVEWIIANCAINELDRLSKLAASKKMVLINAMVPNDGNVRNNPYFVVINSTLPTQGEQIYAYLKKNYPGQQVIYLTRKGSSETYLRSVFETLNKVDRSTAMHIKFTEVKDSLSAAQIAANLFKDRSSLFVIGSLDNGFADKLLDQLSRLSKTYPQITVMGMPTWDNLNFSKYKGLDLVYSTPFYSSQLDITSRNIISYYNSKMYARPSDLVFRAYDLTYHFGRLLNQYGNDIAAALASKEYRVFYDYDIQPVSKTTKIDYYENKKLYFLEYSNGVFKRVR